MPCASCGSSLECTRPATTCSWAGRATHLQRPHSHLPATRPSCPQIDLDVLGTANKVVQKQIKVGLTGQQGWQAPAVPAHPAFCALCCACRRACRG